MGMSFVQAGRPETSPWMQAERQRQGFEQQEANAEQLRNQGIMAGGIETYSALPDPTKAAMADTVGGWLGAGSAAPAPMAMAPEMAAAGQAMLGSTPAAAASAAAPAAAAGGGGAMAALSAVPIWGWAAAAALAASQM